MYRQCTSQEVDAFSDHYVSTSKIHNSLKLQKILNDLDEMPISIAFQGNFTLFQEV